MMFSNFIDSIDSDSGCIPLFVIHDALIVDANAEMAKRLLREKYIPLYLRKWKFDALVTNVSDN